MSKSVFIKILIQINMSVRDSTNLKYVLTVEDVTCYWWQSFNVFLNTLIPTGSFKIRLKLCFKNFILHIQKNKRLKTQNLAVRPTSFELHTLNPIFLFIPEYSTNSSLLITPVYDLLFKHEISYVFI